MELAPHTVQELKDVMGKHIVMNVNPLDRELDQKNNLHEVLWVRKQQKS